MKHFCRTALLLILMSVAAHAVPVTLRVVDENNRPVANAEVNYLDYANWQNDAAPSRAVEAARVATDGTLALDLQGAATRYDENGFGTRIAPEPALGAARVSAPGYGTRGALLIVGENRVKLGAATQMSGVVQDETGAALAGARVELVKIEKAANSYDDIRTRTGFALDIVTTGADGRWKFDGLAHGLAALLVSASGKVTADLEVKLDATTVVAPPLRLQNAGMVKGRILDANGRAVPDVGVASDAQVDDGVKTDGEGRFVLSGVPPGENYLIFWSDDGTWLGVDGEVKVTVAAGQTVDVGEVRAGNGVTVSGRLKLEAGEPLTNFVFLVGQTLFRTDATGHFDGRVEKHSYFANFPIGYAMVTRSPYLDPKLKTVDVGDIVVGRATSLPLDIRDENGRPMPQASITFVEKSINGSTYFDGQNVSSTPLLAGDYEVKGFALWEVVGPKTVKVAPPNADEKIEPLRIVVRPLKPTRVSGRVVDERGQGIAGARVSVLLERYGGLRDATSGDDGRWQIEFPTQGAPFSIRTVELKGYKLLRGGEWTPQDNAEFDDWRAADIVMALADAPLTGRVVDETGAPVAGARVSWNGAGAADYLTTPDNGEFATPDVPVRPQTVRASDGPCYAEATATPGTPVKLKLAPVVALPAGTLEQVVAKSRPADANRVWIYTDVLGASRVFEMIAPFAENGDPNAIGELDTYLRVLAARARTGDALKAAAIEGVSRLRQFSVAALSGTGAARIALLAARSDDGELRAWANLWYDAQKLQLSSERRDKETVNATLRVAATGAALGRAEAVDILSVGLFLIDRMPARQQTDYFSWGGLLWNGDMNWFDEASADWSPSQRALAIRGALEETRDVSQARALSRRLQTLAAQNDATENAQKFDLGEFEFARAVAPLDADAAFEVLQKQGAARSSRAVFLVAQSAIETGQIEAARRVLRLEADNGQLAVSRACSLALLARSIDAELAEQLLQLAREKLAEQTEAPDYVHDLAAYAFALHDFDAGTGRLLLENQWALSRAQPQSGIDDVPPIRAQQSLAWAMSIYDASRALQWFDSISQRQPLTPRAAHLRLGIVAMSLIAPEKHARALETLG